MINKLEKQPLSKHRNLIKISLITVIVIIALCVIANVGLLIMKRLGKLSLTDLDKATITGKNIESSDLTEEVRYQNNQYIYNQDLINILVLGVDNAEPLSKKVLPGDLGQTDAIYLVSLDMKTKEVHVIGIPRDTVVPISIMTNDNKLGAVVPMQITLQYAYGNDVKAGSSLSAQAVSTLLGNIPIQDVCVINWDTVAVVNDAIGGVTVTIQDTFTDESGEEVDSEFYQGNTVTLKGNQAWLFVKERDCNLFGSALTRISNQEQYIDAFINQAKKSFKKNIFLPVGMYLKIITSDCYYSTLSVSEYIYLVSQLQEFQILKESIDTLPGNVEKGIAYEGGNSEFEVETGFEEFHIDEEELRGFLISHFYKKK